MKLVMYVVLQQEVVQMLMKRDEVLRLAGIELSNLIALYSAKVIPYTGTMYLMQVMAVAVGHELRVRGYEYKQIAPVVWMLWWMSQDRWEDQMANGRSHLLIIGPLICSHLMTLDAAQHPKGVDLDDFEKLSGWRSQTFDCGAVWLSVCERLNQERGSNGNDMGNERKPRPSKGRRPPCTVAQKRGEHRDRAPTK
jgi:hypothetical protein